MTKVCGTCKKRKPAIEFAKNGDSKDGLAWRCKVCHAAYIKVHREKNPNYYRSVQLRCKFGITLEEYDEMLEEQGGVCAVCGGTCKTGKALAVDHDHETGKVRGLLCSNCNQAIGKLSSVDLLLSAASYLLLAENESQTAIVG